MEFAIWLIVGLALGGAIGALATWWISRARGGVVSVMQLKQENDKFRDEVAEHFVETARLINQMSESYKQVFDHLSSGAEKLVDDEKLAERLPPASGQEVRLSQFGASASSGSSEENSGQSEARPAGQAHKSASDSDKDAGKDTGGNAAKDAGKTPAGGKDPLKSASGQSGARVSRPSASGSKDDSESGNDGNSESDDGRRQPDGSAKKSASASNQAGKGSRTRD